MAGRNYPGERADERTPPLARDFVEANLLEVSGKRQESLAKFRALQRALVNQGGSLQRSGRRLPLQDSPRPVAFRRFAPCHF